MLFMKIFHTLKQTETLSLSLLLPLPLSGYTHICCVFWGRNIFMHALSVCVYVCVSRLAHV